MTIEHILGFFSKEHGGPTVAIASYAQLQASLGQSVRLRVLEGFRHTSPATRIGGGVDQEVFPVDFPQVACGSRRLKQFLRTESAPSVYHLHGTWPLASRYGADEAARRAIPYIVHLMGSFQPEELQRKPWRKRLFRAWHVDEMLRSAACLHVNSRMEMMQLRGLGFQGPFAVIPVGFDDQAADRLLGEIERGATTKLIERWKGRRFVLYLARVHANKGVELLLSAWQSLAAEFPETHLLIAGPGNPAYRGELQARVNGSIPRVIFLDYVSELEKAWLYQNCTVYCLPSFSENYGATIQDALGFGAPVVTTTRTPWEDVARMRVGWIVEPALEPLVDKLRLGLAESPEGRAATAQRARAWIRSDFGLHDCVSRQVSMYRWALGEGDRPDFVLSSAR